MKDIDLTQANTRELLTLFSRVMKQLRKREVVRSGNNPVADYSEALVVRALNLTRWDRSFKGCDAVDANGKNYEIKGRRITEDNPSTQLSVIRDLESCHFHYLVGVLFDEDFNVTHGYSVPHEAVPRLGSYREYVKGWVIHVKPELWKQQPGFRDVTSELQKAQREWI